MTHNLSICAIYRDEAPYLREWIEFHRLVGVERFYLYDNASEDEHLEVLAPYIEDGTVVLSEGGTLPWRLGPQGHMYNHCLREHENDSRWIAFLDIDEFLFSAMGRPLTEVLVDYEASPGVGVCRAWFGTSGHRTKPAGLVIENYTRRMRRGHSSVKSIVQPSRTSHCLDPHVFAYRDGLAVDTDHNPIEGPIIKSYPLERLRINHYYTKSEEECAARKRWRQELVLPHDPNFKEARPFGEKHENYNHVVDETILPYAPALRAALARREQQAPAGSKVERSG